MTTPGTDKWAEGRHRLAEHMERSRRLQNLTWLEVAQRGGPSMPTLRQLRHADPIDWPPSTLRKLDEGLGWEPGSSVGLLYGTIDEPRLRRAGGSQAWWDDGPGTGRTVLSEDVRRGLEHMAAAASFPGGHEDWEPHRAAS